MQLIFLSVIFLLAGIGAEVVGFGISAISMSLLPLLLPVSSAIPVVAIISVIATGHVAYTTKAKNLSKYLIPLLIGSIVGIPIGMYLLQIVSEQFLLTFLGFLLVISGSYSLIGEQLKIKFSLFSGIVVGILTGIFGASVNVNGPLVGLYLTQNKKISKIKNKDIITTYMFITGLFVVLGHYLSGRINEEVLYHSLIALPSLFIGMGIGKVLFKRIPVKLLRVIIYTFVLLSGIKLIFEGFMINR